MNTLKIKKGQQGFTLVEVIVVAIIVAALAAVAVPMYTSYVTSSRTNAAANAAGSVASFMGVCLNQAGKVGDAAIAHAGTKAAGPKTITCTTPSGTDTDPIMQLPVGIKIDIDQPASTGTVTAQHIDGGEAQSYKY
jgi:prepilin-type N-terminal cleavage/methylation domain-containing protein